MARIILTGLNGYGGNLVKELLQDINNELVAVVSGAPERSEYYLQLMDRGTRFYQTIESCLAKECPDMAIICTPMHIHYREVMACLEKGISVYCEKPLVTTMDSLANIQKAANEKGAIVAVGFQWSFSKGIQHLKKDILCGKYGKLKNIKSLVNWIRPISYYKNSNWKGRNIDASGHIIYDNLASNAGAHFLHNMLFLSGPEMTKALDIREASVNWNAYRAHDIETFDTLCLKIKKDDLQIGFWGTLVSDSAGFIEFEATCEQAKIVYPYDKEKHIAAICKGGTVVLYDNPDNNRYKHYQEVAEALESGTQVACDMNTVEPFQQMLEHMRLHMEVKEFDRTGIVRTEDSVVVKDLSKKLRKAYLEESNLEE